MSHPPRISTETLAVEFYRVGDRVAHRILVRGAGDEWSIAAESLEGDADQAWPASPPLQELHIERRSDGQSVALLVGRAGKSHWSASFEFDSTGRLCVDVACRVQSLDADLASTYTIEPADSMRGDAHGPASRGNVANIEFSPDSTSTRLDGSRGPSGEFEARQISLRPLSTAVSPPQTIRWRYGVARVMPNVT